MSVRREILDAVRALPAGSVVAYGDVARVCGSIPVLVGKALAFCADDVPWQRVVGSDGTLRTARRGAAFAARQRELLEAEGVAFDPGGRVEREDAAWERGHAALREWSRGAEGEAPKGKPRAPTNGAGRADRERPSRARRGPADAGNTTE